MPNDIRHWDGYHQAVRKSTWGANKAVLAALANGRPISADLAARAGNYARSSGTKKPDVWWDNFPPKREDKMNEQILSELKRNNQLLASNNRLLMELLESIQAQNAATWHTTPEGLPICSKHNAVMQKREKQGDVWHSHKIVDPHTGEEHYCRGYETINGSGWNVEPHVSKTANPIAGFEFRDKALATMNGDAFFDYTWAYLSSGKTCYGNEANVRAIAARVAGKTWQPDAGKGSRKLLDALVEYCAERNKCTGDKKAAHAAGITAAQAVWAK